MSLIDMSQFDRVRITGGPLMAIDADGPGDLVLGVAGPVDRATAERIGALLRDLRPHCRGRLLVTLSRLGPWDPHLARVLGRAREHHLGDGSRLELHGAPAALLAELDPAPALSRPGPHPRRDEHPDRGEHPAGDAV